MSYPPDDGAAVAFDDLQLAAPATRLAGQASELVMVQPIPAAPLLMPWVYDDGGRTAAGFSGRAGDCVCRAIAIAAMRPYREVYDALNALAKRERTGRRKRSVSSARNGVYRSTSDPYLRSIGWRWTPTMRIGSGCTVHLAAGELPMGRLIVTVSRHLVAVINGVVHDTHDSQRLTLWCTEDGAVERVSARCVYGYWQPPAV